MAAKVNNFAIDLTMSTLPRRMFLKALQKRLQQLPLFQKYWISSRPVSYAAISTGQGSGSDYQDQEQQHRFRKWGFGSKVLTAAAVAATVSCFNSWGVEKKFGTVYANCDCGTHRNKKCPSDCLHQMDKEEELISKANQDLETALKDIKPKAMESTEIALKAYCEAYEAEKKFADKAYCAFEELELDSPRFDEVWCELNELLKKRCERYANAMCKATCAWDLMCRLRKVIKDGKACKYSSCNPLLTTAEEALCCAETQFNAAKDKLDKIHSESQAIERLKNMIQEFRSDLKAEFACFGDLECRQTFTPNECLMILTWAYKKIIRIQLELELLKKGREC